MSEIAAETLVGLGFTNVFNLMGGMVAWEQAGLPIER
jgi:rhodanese-related sulfurtransferase